MTIALNGTTGYLRHPDKLVGAFPMSMAIWVAASVGVSQQMVITQSDSASDRWTAGWFTNFGNTKNASLRNPGTTALADKTTTPHLSASTMQLLIVVFESTTSRRVYFGSNTPGTGTTSGADGLSNHNQAMIGALQSNGGANQLFLNGSIAEAHWYNAALTATDYDAMTSGTLPEAVAGWVDGWTFQTFDAGGTYTSIGGKQMTAFGGVTSSGIAHPITRSGDTTAPTLTSPTGTQTGSTTASGSVSTNEANGTLYRLASVNASETAATVKAANITTTVTATGVQSVTFTGLTASTTYFAHYVHRDAAGNDSTVATSASFTTAAAGDVTPPVLTGSITIGTVTSTSIQMSWPAGSDNVAVAGYDVSSNGGSSYTSLGNVLTHTFTGLTPSTSYQLRVRARDAAGNLSTPVLSASQSTSAPPAAAITFGPLRNNTGTILASETGATVHAYTVAGALVVSKTSQTSNGSGMVTVTDAALTAATEYRYVIVLASGAEGMGKATAA